MTHRALQHGVKFRPESFVFLLVIFLVVLPIVCVFGIYEIRKRIWRRRLQRRNNRRAARQTTAARTVSEYDVPGHGSSRIVEAAQRATAREERRDFVTNILMTSKFRPNMLKNADSTACAICLEEYKKGERICWSHNKRCKHVFHRACICEWLLDHDTCPCCRQHVLSFDDSDEPFDTIDRTHTSTTMAEVDEQDDDRWSYADAMEAIQTLLRLTQLTEEQQQQGPSGGRADSQRSPQREAETASSDDDFVDPAGADDCSPGDDTQPELVDLPGPLDDLEALEQQFTDARHLHSTHEGSGAAQDTAASVDIEAIARGVDGPMPGAGVSEGTVASQEQRVAGQHHLDWLESSIAEISRTRLEAADLLTRSVPHGEVEELEKGIKDAHGHSSPDRNNAEAVEGSADAPLYTVPLGPDGPVPDGEPGEDVIAFQQEISGSDRNPVAWLESSIAEASRTRAEAADLIRAGAN